ncbi:Glutathione-S-transferase [Drechslerella dactyloides]|uniref:Glutathione-S-transferase n=1 Tax=Drechslerella dactyloides TaxID=74499 RepID=A0AAD6NHE0_DREDA|nr:Glutathione-S-transferase [Drechslerella dactyloides]
MPLEQSDTMSSQPELTLYTSQAPNGVKVSIALELLGLPYKTHPIALPKLEQKEPWFLEINPNGRIPALTDHNPPSSSDGKPLHIMESGAILLYLAETYDAHHKISFPKTSREHWEMVQWVLWQNAGLGPMQGQAGHFVRYAPEKIQYGVDRYVTEGRRLYGVLDRRLQEQEGRGSGYIVGDHISVADITCFGWAVIAEWAGIELDEFPNVQKWIKRMEAVEAVEKGRNVPEPSGLRQIMGDKEKMDAYAAKSSAWILKGMKNDAKM